VSKKKADGSRKTGVGSQKKGIRLKAVRQKEEFPGSLNYSPCGIPAGGGTAKQYSTG